MRTYGWGTKQLWEHGAVELYSRENIELWYYTAVGTWSCEIIHGAVGT